MTTGFFATRWYLTLEFCIIGYPSKDLLLIELTVLFLKKPSNLDLKSQPFPVKLFD